MSHSPTWHPQATQVARRFEAWWRCEIIDRPPVTLWCHGGKSGQPVIKQHTTKRERWMDIDFNIHRFISSTQGGIFLGDRLPVYMPNLGPEILSTLLGAELEFGETTSWSKPIVHDIGDWDRVLQTPPQFDNPYWQWIEDATRRALELSQGRFLVAIADLHGNLDLLAGLREPESLCMDLLEEPELMARAALHAADVYVQAFERLHKIITDAGQVGSTTWTHYYHQGPTCIPSCDFWCMLSHELSRDIALPAIKREMEPLERSIFHLDGPGALRHLDMVLELPGLNAVQWVYGDGHGPAANWIEVYQRCQTAGKAVQVLASDAADAMTVLDALDPRGVWLQVGQGFADQQAAEAFLAQLGRLTR